MTTDPRLVCARGQSARTERVALAVVLAIALCDRATARAQDARAVIGWDAPCGAPAAFVAGVEELGGSFAGFAVEVGVAETGGGAFHGRLLIRRAGEGEPVAREIDDARCADVIDALVIAAALALRSMTSADVAPPEPAAPAAPLAPAPAEASPVDAAPRVALGASLRGGLGPTPGPALAPGVVVALELDRLWAALTLSYWPDSAVTLEGSARGVALWALSTTLEVGYRIGDALAVVPCAVLEPSVAVARGRGVERSREEASVVLDAGAAVWLALDVVAGVRLFARGDVLFGLARPAYGVEAEVVFAGPVVRGTGGAGVLVLF